MVERPNVFGYNDFRLFLADWYDYMRKNDRTFSKTVVCEKLGLPNSRSYFKDVLNGKYVSDIKLTLFIKLLSLPHDEAQFLRVLVRFNQSTDPEEKEILLDQLISLNQTPQTILSRNTYEYYKEWYHAVIRALLDVVDVADDYAGLGGKLMPAVTPRQVRSSMALLRRLGLIRKNESGFYKPTVKVLASPPYAQEEIVRQFQLKGLAAARHALSMCGRQPNRVLTKTISISEQGLKRLEKHLDKFNSEVRSIVHKDDGRADRVYHLGVLLVPHLKKA
jgi:uncharacterized protein (TIGR02147 family)